MRPDTPLTEVATHLPKEAAAHLICYDEEVQTAVLIQIRSAVVFWETQRYVFDPVAYEGVLNGLVPSLAPLFAELTRLRTQNTNLAVRLAGADYLIRSMGETIAQMLAAETSAGKGGT